MAMFWNSYWHALVAVIKDRNVLLLVIIGPIVYSIYYPFPYSAEQVREIPVVIADLDRTSMSRHLIRLSDASPDIKVVAVVDHPADIKQAIYRGEVEGGLIIPRGLRRSVLRGETASTIVLGNGAYFMLNRGVLLGFTGAAQTLSGHIELRRESEDSVLRHQALERINPIRLDLRAASNPSGGYSTYVVPAVAFVVLQQTLLLGFCMLMGTWRETGAPFDMRLVKNRLAVVFAAATICTFNTFFYITIVYWLEDYPQLGKAQDLILLTLIFSLTTAAWAVGISSLIRYRVQAFIHLIPTSIPMIFLAGFAWPVALIPQPLVAFSKLLPSTAGIQSFLKVDQLGASITQVLPEIISLSLLFVVVLLFIVARKNWPLPAAE